MSNEERKNDDSEKNKKWSKEDFTIQEYRLVPADQYDGSKEEEIDLIEMVKSIWGNRKSIYKFVALGAVLGLLVALLSPKEYVSSATLMPEYATEGDLGGASSLLQQYGGLIGLSGGTFNSSSNAIRVDLYPKIVESLTFQRKLADQDFYFADYDTTASFMEYYLEIRSPGPLGWVLSVLSELMSSFKASEMSMQNELGPDIVNISEEEMKVIEELRERVTSSLDEETGIVSVTARMRDPRLAALVTKYTIEELTDYLVDYRTEKVQIDLTYIEEQLEAAEARYEASQLALADFMDSNLGSLTRRAQLEEQRLLDEQSIALNVYNTLTQQYEEAKLKVQEETPVFKVLQPVQVPVNDETSGLLILIMFMTTSFLGITSFYLLVFYYKSQNQLS